MLSEIVKNSLEASISSNSYMSPIAEKIVGLFQEIERVSDGEFESCCVKKKLFKGDYLLRQGERTNKIWYIETGIAHEYIQKGKQILTLSFIFPNVFVDYFPSTIGGLPSPRNIRLLTDTEILEIDHEQMMNIESIRSLIYETRSYIAIYYNFELQERMFQLQFLNAQERYANLIERQPYLIKEIPSIYLADYLGVSPETFSRIRSKSKLNKLFENKSTTDYVFEKREGKWKT